MTTTSFTPTALTLFQFQATLDGALYNVITTWNIYRAGIQDSGWYINVYDQSNNRIVTTPLIGSPAEIPINLVAGYFKTSSLVFYEATQTFVVTP